ncbi:hypothetical protein IRJ41_018082 [Triplophysa rosa]|uniref:Uncharacterized protein n=1 Tax=Triplophysa rosa TaxID=992332 RepID=A0A9W7TT53_TRIRA|nr:hypothetical protein IRJ41_018082 [Triplophysa rosa]
MKPKHTWCQQPGMPRVSVSPPVVSRMEAFKEITIFEDIKLLPPIAQEHLVLWRASSGSFQHLLSPRPIIRPSPIMDYLAQQGLMDPRYLTEIDTVPLERWPRSDGSTHSGVARLCLQPVLLGSAL